MPFPARQETVVEAAVAEAPRMAAHWVQVEPEPQARATMEGLRRVSDGAVVAPVLAVEPRTATVLAAAGMASPIPSREARLPMQAAVVVARLPVVAARLVRAG